MRTILSILGICAAIVMCGVSGAMNYLFLFSLGRTPLEGNVLGAASAAADVLKALLPFFVSWSWQGRRFVAALAGVLAFAFFAGFSFLSALGFAADTRGGLVEAREAVSGAYKSIQTDVSGLEARLSGLPAHRPESVVREELEGHKQSRRWASTKECADATEGESRTYCARYFALRSELAAGTEADALSRKIVTLKAEGARLVAAGATQDRDPQVSLLARIFGQAPEPVRLALTVAVALLVEFGASLGLFLASGHGTPAVSIALPEPAPVPEIGSVEDFCLEALVAAKGGALSADELFTAYQAWCQAKGVKALARAGFTAMFERLALTIGLRQQAGRYRGIALAASPIQQRKAA